MADTTTLAGILAAAGIKQTNAKTMTQAEIDAEIARQKNQGQ